MLLNPLRLFYSLIFLLTFSEYVLCFQFPFSSSRKLTTVKTEILELARKVNRGLTENPIEKEKMKVLFETLESMNKNKNTLKDPQLNGNWKLEYTTSDTILGRNGPQKVGPVLQKIDTVNLKAENSESLRYFGLLDIKRKVTANLEPISPSKVAVQFKVFTVGPFSFNAPSSFKGELDVTYLDKDLRLSRGDKGNIFVLTKVTEN